MADKPDPTKVPEFQRTLKNLLSTPHKPQSELKIGKGKGGIPSKPAKRTSGKGRRARRQGASLIRGE